MSDARGPASASSGVEVALSASQTRRASVALRTADGTVTESSPSDAQRGSGLALVAQTLFEELDIAPTALCAVHVDVGPGSYTGLRVAVTWARFAVRFGGSVALRATTSLELAAAVHSSEHPHERVRVALDARRDRVHTGLLHRDESGRVVVLEAPHALETAEFQALLSAGDCDRVLGDPSLTWLADATDKAGLRLSPIPSYSARTLFDRAVTTRETSLDELEPLYLMGSYAE